jgi:hypothetical protein
VLASGPGAATGTELSHALGRLLERPQQVGLVRSQQAGEVRAGLTVADLHAVLSGVIAMERSLPAEHRGIGLDIVIEGPSRRGPPRSDEEEGERRLRTLTSGWSDASAYARPRRGPQTQNPSPCLDARSRCAVKTAKGSPTPVRRPTASSWSARAVVRGDLGFQRRGVHLPRPVLHDLIDQRPARRRGRWRRILG